MHSVLESCVYPFKIVEAIHWGIDCNPLKERKTYIVIAMPGRASATPCKDRSKHPILLMPRQTDGGKKM
jgi:hypothetical protein